MNISNNGDNSANLLLQGYLTTSVLLPIIILAIGILLLLCLLALIVISSRLLKITVQIDELLDMKAPKISEPASAHPSEPSSEDIGASEQIENLKIREGLSSRAVALIGVTIGGIVSLFALTKSDATRDVLVVAGLCLVVLSVLIPFIEQLRADKATHDDENLPESTTDNEESMLKSDTLN